MNQRSAICWRLWSSLLRKLFSRLFTICFNYILCRILIIFHCILLNSNPFLCSLIISFAFCRLVIDRSSIYRMWNLLELSHCALFWVSRLSYLSHFKRSPTLAFRTFLLAFLTRTNYDYENKWGAVADPNESWRIMRAAVDCARELTESQPNERPITFEQRDGIFTVRFGDNSEATFRKSFQWINVTYSEMN